MEQSMTETLTQDAIATELEHLSSLLESAQSMAESGALVDLAPLERRTQDLCDAIARLPAAEAHSLLGPLKGFLDRLEPLEQAMRTLFAQISDSSRATPSHRAAALAYQHGTAP